MYTVKTHICKLNIREHLLKYLYIALFNKIIPKLVTIFSVPMLAYKNIGQPQYPQ